MVAVTSTASISGGHVNPAVTVTQAIFKNFPLKKVPHYLVAQYLGAFVASAVVYVLYYDALLQFDGGIRSAFGEKTSTGHIWATFPASHLTISGALLDQIIGTAILIFAVLTITDARNNVSANLQPMYLCVLITVMCTAFATNCMATLNPARDLGPRLFLLVAGWGKSAFEPLNYNFWWVGGIIGPHIGGLIGASIYYSTINLEKMTRERSYTPTNSAEVHKARDAIDTPL